MIGQRTSVSLWSRENGKLCLLAKFTDYDEFLRWRITMAYKVEAMTRDYDIYVRYKE